MTTVNLTTLNILNWPTGYWFGHPGSYYTSIRPQLERIAIYIFSEAKKLDPPAKKARRLEIVAFGSKERNALLPVPRYFVKAECRCMNWTQMVARQVSLRDLEDENMDVNILARAWRDFDKASRQKWVDQPFYVFDDEDDERYRARISVEGDEGDANDDDADPEAEASGDVDGDLEASVDDDAIEDGEIDADGNAGGDADQVLQSGPGAGADAGPEAVAIAHLDGSSEQHEESGYWSFG